MKTIALIAVLGILSACATTGRKPSSTNSTYHFVRGLQSAPGTNERIQAGLQLNALIEKYYNDNRLSQDPEVRAEQIRSKNVFGMTAQYLMAGQSCKPSEKVRLYRGVGQIPVIRPGNGTDRALNVFGDLTGQIYKGLIQQKLVESYGPSEERNLRGLEKNKDLGEIADQNLAALGLDIEALNWNSLFGWERKLPIAGDLIEGRFDYLADAHTHDSVGSPMISTSLLSSVAEEYGPTILVLDICPERLFPAFRTTDVFGTFWESELYVPFFLLPEEIVRIENRECLLEKMNESKNYPRCMKPVADKDYKANDRTKQFRRIFFNYGYKFERIFLSLLIAVIDSPSAGMELRSPYTEKMKNFYELFKVHGHNLTDWRAQLETFQNKGDCKVAQDLLETGKNLAKFYRENVAPDGEWGQEMSAEERKKILSELEDAETYRRQYKKDLQKECGFK